MRIFFNTKVRNVSIVLTIVQFLAMIFTPGLQWSSNPGEWGFWIAFFRAVSSTLLINWILVLAFTKKENHEPE